MLIFGALVAVYLFLRAIFPLRLSWGWKALLSLLLLVTAFKFHILHLFGGPRFFSPLLPQPVLLLSAWLFTVFFFFFFLMLFADMVRGIYYLYLRYIAKRRSASFRTNSNRANLILLLCSVLLATVGIMNGTRPPSVREQVVVLENLPDEADGMTIAVLADLHVDRLTRADRVSEVVWRTNALTPDIIVLAGDLVDGSVEMNGGDVSPLRELSARYGVFGVAGNHEYYSGYREWKPFFESLGIRMLDDEYALPGGRKLALVGMTDTAAVRMGYSQPDLSQTLGGIPEGTVKVLLSHQPRVAPRASSLGVDLQISGHTHGGMFFGLDRIVAKFNAGFVSGLYEVGDMRLYVSNGTGIWSGFPVRVGVPSEISLLRLQKK